LNGCVSTFVTHSKHAMVVWCSSRDDSTLLFHVPYRLFTVAIGTTVTMSGGLDVLALKEDDVTKLLAAGTHLGNANVDFQMAQYVYKTKADGKYIS